MTWPSIVLCGAIAIVLYVAFINGAFLRCPHCRRIGSWRFRTVGEPQEGVDDEGVVSHSVVRQRCKTCGGKVYRTWSDREGLRLLPAVTDDDDRTTNDAH